MYWYALFMLCPQRDCGLCFGETREGHCVLKLHFCSCCWQVVLDRPEFRQIRCRIQRARELFLSWFNLCGEHPKVHAGSEVSGNTGKHTSSSPNASGSGRGRCKGVGHYNGSSRRYGLFPAKNGLKVRLLC